MIVVRFIFGGMFTLLASVTAIAADMLPPPIPNQQVSPFATDTKTQSAVDLPLPGGAGSANSASPHLAFDFSVLEVVFIRENSASLRAPIKDGAVVSSGDVGAVRYRTMEVVDGQKIWLGGQQLYARVYSDRVMLSFACNGKSECGVAWEGELSAPAYYFIRPNVSQKGEAGAKNPATLPLVGITWGGTQGSAANQSTSPAAP